MKVCRGMTVVYVWSVAVAIFLLMPFLSLLWNTSLRGIRQAWLTGGLSAVTISMETTLTAVLLIVLLGTPIGWIMARSRTKIWRIVEILLLIPLLMPPLVVGLLLMYLFGPYGWIGQWFSTLQWTITNSATAVVLAQFYEAAPYYIFAAAAAFSQVDPAFEQTSWSLGRTPWQTLRKVTIPLAAPGLSAGLAMAFSRAVGAFGAVIVIAYYPHTLPVDIWVALQEQGLPAALPLAMILLLIALPLPLLMVIWRQRRDARM